MIKSFRDKETQGIWNGIRSTKLPFEIQHIARRKLRMLNNAEDIFDLIVPPSNRWKSLKATLASTIVFESISSGVSLFSGMKTMHSKLKSSIIIEQHGKVIKYSSW